jgi:uncharacterized protein
LRTRASRMAPFGEGSEAEAALARLRDRPDGPFVAQLAREPNRRDSRWAHLFSGPAADSVPARDVEQERSRGSADGVAVSASEVSFPGSRNDERLAKVEQEVLALRAELDELKRRLGE